MPNHTIRLLKFAILEVLTTVDHQHKVNLIGRAFQEGYIELHLGEQFTPEERVLASRAFEELKSASLIRPTYRDISNPEAWVEITDLGHKVLEKRALDSLDEALLEIGSHLAEMRDGAWAALASNQPDSIRQAAHSGRELIDQVLKEGTSDDEIRAQPNFVPDPNSSSGITRRHRLKYIMAKFQGSESDSDLRVIERACDLVIEVDRNLMAYSHAREAPVAQDGEDALRTTEMALRKLLVNE